MKWEDVIAREVLEDEGEELRVAIGAKDGLVFDLLAEERPGEVVGCVELDLRATEMVLDASGNDGEGFVSRGSSCEKASKASASNRVGNERRRTWHSRSTRGHDRSVQSQGHFEGTKSRARWRRERGMKEDGRGQRGRKTRGLALRLLPMSFETHASQATLSVAYTVHHLDHPLHSTRQAILEVREAGARRTGGRLKGGMK